MVDLYMICFTLFLICYTIISRLHKSSSRNTFHLPPMPFRIPIIGHLHLLTSIPHQDLQKLSIQHGPIFRLFLGSTPWVVVSSPEAAKDILKTNDSLFLDRPYNSVIDYFTYGSKGFVFANHGPYWKFFKKITMSKLLSSTTLDHLLPMRRDEITCFIKYLYKKSKDGKSVKVEEDLMKLTSNVISRMFMNKRYPLEDDKSGDLPKVIGEIGEIIGKFNFSDHIWFCKHLDLQGYGKASKDIKRRFDILVDRILKEHEDARQNKKDNNGEMKDMLNILLDISEDDTMEVKLSRENIRVYIMDILSAGIDTTALTIEWALAELINHPNIIKKAVEEIDQVVGQNRLVQESDIPNLPYLQSIVKESLRLHPTLPMILKSSTQDCTIAGYHIPAKTNIFINVWSIGRDETHWESPLEFRPERFEETQIDVRGRHYQLLPFGSGRRMCPGISLGLLMVHTILGSMIQCFDWRAEKDGNLTNTVDMEECPGITIPRANPLVCIPVARLDPIPLSN
uniref:cytochrome P450 93A3-like n=1 Tax=Erigeron canadensis TaxID=72917 RepID=UPI001CB917BC|nr:cytochrome P450 93A3-like [Erigeron canadensis]